jgi:hypothetical protein
MMAFTKKGGIAITMAFMSESCSFKIETMRVGDFCGRMFILPKTFCLFSRFNHGKCKPLAF